MKGKGWLGLVLVGGRDSKWQPEATRKNRTD